MRLLNWNVARLGVETDRFRLLLEWIGVARPLIACLTETHEAALDSLGGFALSDRGVLWGGETDTERKVLLWGREPWTDVDRKPDLSALGGYVAATTSGPLGPVRVVAVCMPYHMAWPRGVGMEQRPAPWSQHIAFLDLLEPILRESASRQPTILMGDFNQFLPLSWGSWAAHHRLVAVLKGLSVVTRDEIEPIGEATVNHVAVSRHFRAQSVRGLSRFGPDGQAVSDHFGVVVDLGAGGVQVFD